MLDIFTREGLILFLYSLPALLISLSVHEYSHAMCAYKLGDKSQKAMGRLTLQPFAHIDIFGFICIALLGFGWGKPVMIDDRNFKNKKRDNMLVAIAGPLSNLVLALIFTILFKIMYMTNLFSLYSLNVSISNSIYTMMYYAISFNVVFAIFNMIPLPPFDGSKVLFYFLPSKFKGIMYILERYSFYIILIFLISNLGSLIISPLYSFIMKLIGWFILL